jgi:hypothetical protein
VNASSMHLSYEDVLRYDEEISEQLAAIPKWKSTNVSSESHTFSRLLLDIQLRQFLILLHSPFVGPAESNSRASFSRAACINAAITILEHHYQLRSAGTHLLYLLRNDVYRASMAIFHSVSLSKSIQGRFPVRILEKFSKLLQKISLFRT